ncbi:uncharacterized protein LOC755623 isoform X1 [Strongylocentrotus purpuratus]|uniref:Uncharacterized protein n=1 Tax=Strongylocentrotus purpuratus TaxID=7668 RepID=A0A7M7G0Z5_STRPU|nr:uncharacterized protein LOC755623 isoform X1 [Strongylocentrotus purpuratus]|eukprot:XP_001190912.1 PREDICTED: uncharacterized protein LOC755623 isoform X1 [Strongylocentrotus purpuratus]
MQPYLPGGRSDDPLELSFPHIKLASPEDELLNKSLLDSLTPASPSSSAPYRLPKLSCTGSVSSTCTSGSDRSEGALRNGQSLDGLSPRSQQSKKSNHSKVLGMSTRSSSRLPIPPYTIAQLRRAQNIYVPSFKKAQFAPLISSPARRVDTPEESKEEKTVIVEDRTRVDDRTRVEDRTRGDEEIHVRVQPANTRASTRYSHVSRTTYGPRSAAVSMTIPMATGSDYSHPQPDQNPEWRLSPYRHKNYDNQAVTSSSGPYSRKFVIHCSAPKSWLHMKLRRSKTTLT